MPSDDLGDEACRVCGEEAPLGVCGSDGVFRDYCVDCYTGTMRGNIRRDGGGVVLGVIMVLAAAIYVVDHIQRGDLVGLAVDGVVVAAVVAMAALMMGLHRGGTRV